MKMMDVGQKETVAKSVLDDDYEEVQESAVQDTPVCHKAADFHNYGFLDDDSSSSEREAEDNSSDPEREAEDNSSNSSDPEILRLSQMRKAGYDFVEVPDTVFFCTEDGCSFASGVC